MSQPVKTPMELRIERHLRLVDQALEQIRSLNPEHRKRIELPQEARELIAKGGAVGRRLDFLAQEFHREVNTCCSKSNDIELTKTGLEMKNVVEQFREQVQNLE